jgi:hypothetical protein
MNQTPLTTHTHAHLQRNPQVGELAPDIALSRTLRVYQRLLRLVLGECTGQKAPQSYGEGVKNLVFEGESNPTMRESVVPYPYQNIFLVLQVLRELVPVCLFDF